MFPITSTRIRSVFASDPFGPDPENQESSFLGAFIDSKSSTALRPGRLAKPFVRGGEGGVKQPLSR